MYILGNDGIESETTYPYKEDVEHTGLDSILADYNLCTSKLLPDIHPCTYNRSRRVATDKGYFRLRPKNETLLRDVIAADGPVSAAFYGSMETFYFYADGIYDDPDCPSGTTHSILISTLLKSLKARLGLIIL